MRIGQSNNGSYDGFIEMISKMSGKNNFINNFLQEEEEEIFGSANGNYNGNTIEDVLSGHIKNSYGIEGMDITGRNDYKRTVKVSDKAINNVIDDVKKEFYKYGGMSGDNMAEHDAYTAKIQSYIKTVNIKDRASAAWTLDQIHLDLACTIKQKVQEKDPSWQPGMAISSDILDEIFSDESIMSRYTNKTSRYKGIDIKI